MCVNVTGIDKRTNTGARTYGPWGGARLEDAVGEQERQGGSVLRIMRASARTMAEEIAERWCA
eukprot:scaffold27049_cov64-Phaeocystis_antarctica.AAC.3